VGARESGRVGEWERGAESMRGVCVRAHAGVCEWGREGRRRRRRRRRGFIRGGEERESSHKSKGWDRVREKGVKKSREGEGEGSREREGRREREGWREGGKAGGKGGGGWR